MRETYVIYPKTPEVDKIIVRLLRFDIYISKVNRDPWGPSIEFKMEKGGDLEEIEQALGLKIYIF